MCAHVVLQARHSYNEGLKCKTLCALGYHHVNGYLNATLLVGTHYHYNKVAPILIQYHSRVCTFDDPVP